MRVTMNMIYNNTTRFINRNTVRYYELEEVLATTKKINRPSDDPVGMSRALDLRKSLGFLDQLDRNLGQAEAHVSQTETALSNVVDRLQRAIELTVDINGGIAGPGDFAAAAEEMDGVLSEVIRNANMKYGKRYIFAGFESLDQPFDEFGNYNGGPAGQDVEVQIAQGQTMAINFTGDEVFKGPLDIMQVITDTRDAIASGVQDDIATQIPLLQDALDQALAWQASIGVKTNRIDIARDDNAGLRVSLTAILSNVEDADIVTASTEFAIQEQVLQATLIVANRILSQNFLDFLV